MMYKSHISCFFRNLFHAIISSEMSNHFIQSSVSHRIEYELQWIDIFMFAIAALFKRYIQRAHNAVGVPLLMVMLFPMEIGVE